MRKKYAQTVQLPKQNALEQLNQFVFDDDERKAAVKYQQSAERKYLRVKGHAYLQLQKFHDERISR